MGTFIQKTNLKTTSMKNFILSIFAILFLGTGVYGQTSKKEIIDISSFNTNSTLEYKYKGDKVLGFDFSKSKAGGTMIVPNIKGTIYDKVKVELYNQKGKIAEYIDSKESGPNSSLNNFRVYESGVLLDTHIVSKEEFWPVVAAVVLCCVQAEVGYSEADGWSGSVGFDCDCLRTTSNAKKAITIKGKTYELTHIKFIPLGQTKAKHSKVDMNQLTMSLR